MLFSSRSIVIQSILPAPSLFSDVTRGHTMTKMHNVGTFLTFKIHNVETVPLCKTHNFGTVPSYNLMEDHLWYKKTFDRGRPLADNNFLQKTTFDGRLTFDGGQPLTEGDLRRKTTFNGRRPLIGCIVYYLKKMFTTPHLDSHSATDPKPEILSAV